MVVRGEETGFYLPLQPVFSPSKWPVEPELHPAPALLVATASANPLAVAVLREPRPFLSRPPPLPRPLVQEKELAGATKCQLQGSVGARGEHAQPPWVGTVRASVWTAAKCASGVGAVCFSQAAPGQHILKELRTDTRSHLSSVTGSCDPERTVTVCARICPIAR